MRWPRIVAIEPAIRSGHILRRAGCESPARNGSAIAPDRSASLRPSSSPLIRQPTLTHENQRQFQRVPSTFQRVLAKAAGIGDRSALPTEAVKIKILPSSLRANKNICPPDQLSPVHMALIQLDDDDSWSATSGKGAARQMTAIERACPPRSLRAWASRSCGSDTITLLRRPCRFVNGPPARSATAIRRASAPPTGPG